MQAFTVGVVEMMRAFHRCQQGTTMTEFVITLPIFVIAFLGIVGLHQIQDAATRAHPAANRALWQMAYEVANSEPSSQWGDPAFEGDYKGMDFDDLGYEEAKNLRRHEQGTLAEALNGANFESRNWRFRAQSVSESECILCVTEEVYGYEKEHGMVAIYGSYVRWDSALRTPPMPERMEPELRVFTPYIGSPSKSRLAYAAGSRYGVVGAAGESSVEWKRWKQTFTPQYQVAAPPKTLEEDDEAFATVGQARVELERFEPADLLELGGQQNFYPAAFRGDLTYVQARQGR